MYIHIVYTYCNINIWICIYVFICIHKWCHTYIASRHTYGLVRSHKLCVCNINIWISIYVFICIHKWCHTCISSRHTYGQVRSHKCTMYKCTMSRIWIDPHKFEVCHVTNMKIMSHMYGWQALSFISIHMSSNTHTHTHTHTQT